MNHLQPPEPLIVHGSNIAEQWKKFKQAFSIYSVATGLKGKSKEVRSATFLHIVGNDAIQTLYNTFDFKAETCHADCNAEFHSIECIQGHFENFCTPRKNITVERHAFFLRNQIPGETFDMYLTDLKKKSSSCEFGDLRDSLIKDRIVLGINSDEVRGRLLREVDLTLEKAEAICRAAEQTAAHLKAMGATEEVRAINKETESKRKDCQYCGKKHEKRKCPAYGQKCNKCHKMNHFSSVCRSKAVNAVEESYGGTEFLVGVVDGNNGADEWTSQVELEGHRITFTLDTGAQVNIIPMNLFKRLKSGPLSHSSAKLTAYNGQNIPVVGKCVFACTAPTNDKTKASLEFQVVDTSSKPILGLAACETLRLVKRVDVIEEEYADVFEGLGCFSEPHTIRVDENCKPVVHAARKVPVALQEELKKELDKMEQNGVIEKVDYPTDWVNSLVIVEKKSGGGLRICLDPRDLNRAIRREHYSMPTVQEIASRVCGSTVFSVLDANSAFWQIKLDEQSSDYTCFNTPYGRYKFLRLPFGLNSASEVFAKRFHQAFENIPGVETYMDEMLIAGNDLEEHDKRLRMVLERARDNNIKLKPSKCSLRVSEVRFVGHVFTEHGLKLDDSKVSAILDMPTPSCKKELERFLGLTNYVGKWLPNLSAVAEPLRQLLKKESEWQWQQQQEDAFNQLKNLVTKAPVLAFFDAKQQIVLSVDASQKGLGAVLMQNQQPVAYASRTMTECEERYAQIEKEMLAIVFGLEHFHYYVYGHTVTVETDHKPLEAIFQKPLSRAPARLQRMLLRTMKYDMKLMYRPGKEMTVPDALSRASLPTPKGVSHEDWEAQVHMISRALSMSDESKKEFQVATAEDSSLQSLLSFVRLGWPENKAELPEEVRPFWGYKEEITEAEGLLFRGEQLIVPKTLRGKMLHKVHEGHLGRDKCLSNARQTMFWPGMSAQIANAVASCSICNKYQGSQQKEPMIVQELPNLPWQKIGIDIFTFAGQSHVIMVDYFSNFIEFSAPLRDLSAAEVIIHLKSQFARYGIPQQVVSDNGPQLNCQEMFQFAQDWGFEQIFSSPRYPKANGLAERSVQTVKNLLTKARETGQDPYIALLQYRNTPIVGDASPAQLFMNRRLRTKLPSTDRVLKPQVPDQNLVQESRRVMKHRQAEAYNKTALPKPRSPLKEGQEVYMQHMPGSCWKQATVIAPASTPRSFVVKTPDGQEYRRNRSMLRSPLKPHNVAIQDKPSVHCHFSSHDSENDCTPVVLSNSHSQVAQSESGVSKGVSCEPVLTRSGREVKKPARYND